MPALERKTLLDALNAKPYTNWGGEDDALISDATVINQEQKVLDINIEHPMDEWQPISTTSQLVDDTRLPNWFLDGAVSSLEIAGSARDHLGYPRIIRAGQMGAGAISRYGRVPSHKQFWRFISLNTLGYAPYEVEPLRKELAVADIPHLLLDWQPDNNGLDSQDLMTVRQQVRQLASTEMLRRERAMIGQLREAVYADGRYLDHAPSTDNSLVVGVIKSQRARYLQGHPLEVLYQLDEGERTPAFTIEKWPGAGADRPENEIVTFYVRLAPVEVVGPAGGLARVELSGSYFRTFVGNDWSLLDAIAADLTMLRTRDSSYPRGAVTIEPVRTIERELHLIFRDTKMAAVESLWVLLN